MIAGYQILDWLGTTAGSRIYRARRLADQAPVLLKLLEPESATPAQIARFRREYDLLQALNVPGVIKPLAFIAEHSPPAMVLEEVAGASLETVLRQHRLDWPTCLRLASHLAEILAGVHAAQVIHLDVRPANMLIAPETGQVCLVDFNLASLREHERLWLTRLSVLEGAWAYLSPEQTGRMNRLVDYRTDFYSLGVTFYQMLTGQLPFQASDPLEWVHCHLAHLPRPPAEVLHEVPLIVSEIAMKLLAKLAEDRYQSGHGLQFDLEQCLAQWDSTGQIAPFVLGTQDVSDRFQIPQKLYGRETEVATHDITERKDAEEALRQSQQKYASLVDSVDGIVWEADARTFTFNFVSHQAERLLGYPVERWLTEPTFWKDHIHPDDQEWAVNFCVKSTQEKRPHDFEYRMLAADGRVVWLRDIVTVVVEHDQPVRLRGIMVDVTEHKRAEEALRQAEAKYRGIFENAVEGIFQSTPSGKFIAANPAMAYMLGYESPAELMATITDIQTQLYVEPERRSEFTRLLEENDSQQYERELYRKDGSTVWVSVNVRAVRDTSGQVLYYEGMAEDITERKRAEEELQRRADEFAALYDTARDLATQQDFSTLMQAIVERALSLLNLPSGGISLYDPARGDLEVVFAKEKVVPLGTRVPFGEGITGRVAQSRQPLIINDFPTWKPGSPWLAGKGIKSLISVPMLSGGELIGVLSVGEHKMERKFTDADARLLSLFAAQAASAIRNAHLLEETRTRAEQLAISEERTRLIVDSAYDAFIAIDTKGLITDWNHQAEDIFGWSREEAMGQFLAETIIPAQHREAYKRGLESFLATGKGPMLNRRIEVTALHRDGHEFSVELTITPIRWGDSYIFSAFVHDITEQKQAEEATKESEERLRLVFEAAKIGTGELDLQTNQITFSNALQRVVGLAPGTFNLTFEEYVERVHPEDRARLSQVVENVIADQPTKAGQPDIAIDYRIVWPDGSVHWTTSRAKVFYDGAGQAIRIVAALIDITERKRAEEALRRSEAYLAQAQSLSHTGSWAWNVANREFVHWSQEHYRMYGLDPKKGIPSWEAVQQLIHPEDRASCLESIDRAIRERRDCILDYRAILPDGAIRYIHSIGRPVFNASGDLLEFVGTEMDITEQKQAEEELRKYREHLEELVTERTAELAVAKNKAEEADRLKSVFLATMSHELRTPLNSIIGFTGIMLQGLVGPLNKEQKKQLNIVKNSAHHLLNLINEVLDLSKIEAGQIELHLESFDMRVLINQTVQTLAPLAGKKKLKLMADVAPEVNRVISDPRRVEQILINLVNNAIKFTQKGEVRIGCQVRDGWLLTSVADTGIGIQPEDMAKLFTTFRQLDGTLARQHEGTGLGLAICQKLADLLGGEIRVESTWGVGSNFILVLPLNK